MDQIAAILERVKQDTAPAKLTGKTNPRDCSDKDFCKVSLTHNSNNCTEKRTDCAIYRNTINLKLEQCGIYKRFRNANFESIEKQGIPQAVKYQYGEVKDFANNLKTNLDEGRGLLLKGSVGTMKTTLAVAVLQKQIMEGRTGRLISMASLLDNIFSLKAKNATEWAQFEQDLRETPLLVLDDMGSEHTEGWVLTKVDAIISERWNRCRSIIITTNLSNEQLKKTYAERVIDRLKNTMQVINFSGGSLRSSA